MTEEHLTILDYQEAAKRGIDRKTAYQRFYEYAWDKERAITEPKANRNLYKTWKPVLDITGIKRATFYTRVISLGMTPFEACTTPLKAKTGRPVGGDNVRLSERHIAVAVKNDIPRGTVHQRVYTYNWDVKRAITEPVNTRFRKKARQA